MRYIYGADVGGTTIKMGLFDETGYLHDSWEIHTRKEESGKFILVDIADTIKKKNENKSISEADIIGIGVGVPGPVGADGTVYKCVNLGWDIFNVEEALAAITGLKVKAGNDANVATLGEVWQGGAKGYDNAVMVTLGTGVGGGIIQNGKMIAGTFGAGGEIGHMNVNEFEEETCGCGGQGCLEQYVSATGVVRMTKKYLEANPDIESALRSITPLTSKGIFDCAKAGDPVALHMVEETGRILGKALATVACVVDPQIFIIGGGVSKAGEILFDAIRTGYQRYAFHASKGTVITGATLGNNAGIFGAAYLILSDEN